MTETKTKITKADYARVWREAQLAGEKAAMECRPTPMVVFDAHLDGTPVSGGKTYYVGGGSCGFASIVIKPATSGFAKWMKATERTYRGTYGGLSYFIHAKCVDNSVLAQSLDIKEAWGRAAIKVLRENGIACGLESRLD